MVWLASPTTQTSSRSPSHRPSSRCCSGLTSWYSSTVNQRYAARTASAMSGRSASAPAVTSRTSSKSSRPRAALRVLVGRPAAGRTRPDRPRGCGWRAAARSPTAAPVRKLTLAHSRSDARSRTVAVSVGSAAAGATRRPAGPCSVAARGSRRRSAGARRSGAGAAPPHGRCAPARRRRRGPQARPHLAGGPRGEGDGQRAPRVVLPGGGTVGDAMGDGPGLAGAGAGEHARPARAGPRRPRAARRRDRRGRRGRKSRPDARMPP